MDFVHPSILPFAPDRLNPDSRGYFWGLHSVCFVTYSDVAGLRGVFSIRVWGRNPRGESVLHTRQPVQVAPTETLLMFAQLLEAEPQILPPDALQQAQKLAAELENLSEADMNRAADMIITWMGQFPQEQKVFQKAKKRELKGISQPNQVQWTFPNLQIIEETETTVLITPAPNTEKTSLLLYVTKTLKRWIQKNK